MKTLSSTVRTKHGIPRLATLAIAGAVALSASLPVTAITLEQAKQRGTLRIAIANEIPYGYTNLTGDAEGPGPKTAEHIAKALGIDHIEWVTTSFSSLIPGLQAGRFDIAAAEMAILPDRCGSALFSEPDTSYGEGLLVAAGNPKNIHRYQDFATNKNLKIAVVAGADQLGMLQKLGVPQSNIVMIENNADAISTVSSGRADAYAATSTTVSSLVKRSKAVVAVEDFADPVIDGQPVRSWGAFAFAKDSGSLREAFNQQLADYKKTSEWKDMVSGYGFSSTDIDDSFKRSTQQLCTQ